MFVLCRMTLEHVQKTVVTASLTVSMYQNDGLLDHIENGPKTISLR